MSALFEKATKQKLRFPSTQGNLSVEDLWELSLQSLDTLAKTVNKKLKDESEESFISTRTKSNSELELKLEILKYIISDKMKENEAKKVRVQRNEELKLLNSLLVTNKQKELQSLSSEEILKRIAILQEQE